MGIVYFNCTTCTQFYDRGQQKCRVLYHYYCDTIVFVCMFVCECAHPFKHCALLQMGVCVTWPSMALCNLLFLVQRFNTILSTHQPNGKRFIFSFSIEEIIFAYSFSRIFFWYSYSDVIHRSGVILYAVSACREVCTYTICHRCKSEIPKIQTIYIMHGSYISNENDATTTTQEKKIEKKKLFVSHINSFRNCHSGH